PSATHRPAGRGHGTRVSGMADRLRQQWLCRPLPLRRGEHRHSCCSTPERSGLLMTDDNSGRQADIARAIELARRVEVGQEPLTPFDPAELLTTADAVAAFLADAEATADPAYVAHAQEVAAR